MGGTIEDSCSGEQICICPPGTTGLCESGGTCSPAFGRGYRVGLVGFSLPPVRPDGMCWDDPGCGAPDPYVVVQVDGIEVGRTPAASDIYEGGWSPPAVFDFRLDAGSSLRLEVYDEDLISDDGAFACNFQPISAVQLRSRQASCTGGVGTLRAVIIPF